MNSETARISQKITGGKSIRQLINELQTVEGLESEDRISLNSGDTHHPISLVTRRRPGLRAFAILISNCRH